MAKQVSKEQKLEKLLSLFTPTSFYNIKELEKLGSKVGVRSNLIKDLVTELTNDNHIVTEKIGISNYFWKCPPNEGTELKRQEKNREKLESEIARLEDIKNQLQDERSDEQREEMIKEYEKLNSLEEQPFSLKEYERMTDEIGEVKEFVNTVTEDIFILQKFVCDSYGMERKDFNANFGMNEDFDLIE